MNKLIILGIVAAGVWALLWKKQADSPKDKAEDTIPPDNAGRPTPQEMEATPPSAEDLKKEDAIDESLWDFDIPF